MPAKDRYHDAVRKSLEKDNWQITNDPFILRWGARDLYVDLGAEKLIAIFDSELEVITKWIP